MLPLDRPPDSGGGPARGAIPGEANTQSEHVDYAGPAAAAQARPSALDMQRDAEHLVALGPRAVAELLAELARRHPCVADDLLDRLERYRRLDPATLRALGGDRFPPRLVTVPRAA